MQDRDAVAAIVAGDPRGIAAAYDRHAVPLYSYCRSLLAQPADAAEVMQETLLLATVRLGRLRQPELLRAWLYAAARSDCHRRLRSGQAVPATRPPADLNTGSVRACEPRQLVRAALDGLPPVSRDVVELSLVHGLSGSELAACYGVSRGRARTLRARARRELERSLGALVLARRDVSAGRAACPALAALLARPGQPLGAAERHRISRHADQCAACAGVRRRELSPALQAGVPPLTALAPWFRQHVLSACADATPADRAAAAARAGRFGPAGLPVPSQPPARPGRRPLVRRPSLTAIGAAAAVAAVAISMLFLGSGAPSAPASGARGSAGPGVVANGRGAPSPDAPAGSAPATGAAPTPAFGPVVASGAVSVPPAGGSQAAASSASTPPAAPGTLGVSQRRLVLVDVDGHGVGTFTVTARGGPVSYAITGPADLTVSPASGSLAAGATATITVTSASPVALNEQLTVNPGEIAITVVLGVSL